MNVGIYRAKGMLWKDRVFKEIIFDTNGTIFDNWPGSVDGPGDECLYMDPRVKKENIQQVFESVIDSKGEIHGNSEAVVCKVSFTDYELR